MSNGKTMDIATLIEKFGTEDKCHDFLLQLRWPDGVKCPRCGSQKISRITARRQFDCDKCRYQFSVRVGTLFQDSHLPMWKWFLATYMITHAKKGMSALHLQRVLGVSYKTAWYLSHRIRAAMKQDDGAKLLGVVEVDETWIGGKVEGKGARYTKNKKLVAGAVQRNGRVKFAVIPDAKRKTLEKFLSECVDDKATDIMTDEWGGDQYIEDHNTAHSTVNHSKDEYVRGVVHTNTIEGLFGLVKRAIMGQYHHVSDKHLPVYLDERAFVFNNRENPYIFRDTLIALCQSENLTFERLVA